MKLRLSNEREIAEMTEVDRPLDVQEFLQTLIEKWWLIVLVTCAVTLPAFWWVRNVPVGYQARAVLQVEQEEQRLVGIEEVSRQDLRTGEMLNTIVQNVKNTKVLGRVVRNIGLATNSFFLPGNTNVLSEAKLVNALAGMIVTKLRPETRLVDITVTHPNAEMAQKLANAVAQEFILESLDQRFSNTKAANELLYAEAGKLKQKVEMSERNLQAYKESNKTVSLEDRQNIIVEKLKGLNQKYTSAKADRIQMEADLKLIQSLTNQPEAILTLPSILQDPAVMETRRRVVEQEAQVATLLLRYKPNYPKMLQAQRQLDDLKDALRSLASKAPKLVQSAYDGALARENNLEAALKEVQMESLDLDRKGIEYNVLMREVQSDLALYDSVLKRLKETDLSKGLEKASIAVVEPAMLPGATVKWSLLLVIGGAVVTGLLMSLCMIYLMSLFDSSIRTVDQAEFVLGLPVLAAIPVAKKGRNGTPAHIVADDPGSICSEAFRTLRTTTGILGHEEGKRITLFTSADPNEGKTFFSLNHAICQAQGGKLTLLIDLDLRRPSVGESFSHPPGTPGVTNYLLGKESLSTLVLKTPYPNLYILTAGPKVANPAEELGGDAIKQLLLEASNQFDRIVIDTPPINAVSDTFILLPLAQIICLVVRAGKTPKHAIMRAVELMARANVPPTGIVLNFLPQHSGYRYYYHYTPRNGYKSIGVYGNDYPAKIPLNT
ncbi:GumC family protein [Pedosphaera parvula]|uniref:Capsular exopolysaccharide family n=1 Tax=Pedosphaera parvula (strain Ellin514) TaxID=320771 RepID=B9XAX1_PEDPL|nr:polysaccharide biosynthesis tyrosine autokinase [Pedosphaera parvula]EEF63156.1 capsular exopolysaccharide family [Pedosphaera parvula Ellin514]